MRVAADLAVAASGGGEIQVSIGVRSAAAGGNAEMPEQCLADHVRWRSGAAAGTQVDAGLAVVDRQELRVRVRHVQERQLAVGRNFVELVGSLSVARPRAQ